VGLPGGPVGTQSLTGVLVATVRDPSRRGPGARLISGLEGQGTDGVGRQAHTHFLAYATSPQGPWGLNFESDHVLNVAYNALCGGATLDDIEARRGDRVFLDGIGAPSLPDPTAAGDFCRRWASDRCGIPDGDLPSAMRVSDTRTHQRSRRQPT